MKFFRRKAKQPPAPAEAPQSGQPAADDSTPAAQPRADDSSAAPADSEFVPAAPRETEPTESAPPTGSATAPAAVDDPHSTGLVDPAGAGTAVDGSGDTLPHPASPAAAESAKSGFFARLRRGLGRTSDNLVSGLGNLFLGRKTIDDDLLEELESRLLMADVGVEATTRIIAQLTARVSRRELGDAQALLKALRDELQAILTPCERALDTASAKPFVILVVGVNGVGKTTTIGKLARRFQQQGQSVMLAAGDTFRAAAVEQLQVWGERHAVPVIAQHTGADSASVLYDALQAAQARGIDVLIADTAGRLHNKSHLMDELRKVVRVLGKLDAAAPHEVLLVLDAGTGQNALAQAAQFTAAVGVSGIALTKLDGTAKGGVIFAIAEKLGLPIRFIGVGEKAEDLRPFAAGEFIEALFSRD
jgi:fused signal recognition particle receptor